MVIPDDMGQAIQSLFNIWGLSQGKVDQEAWIIIMSPLDSQRSQIFNKTVIMDNGQDVFKQISAFSY